MRLNYSHSVLVIERELEYKDFAEKAKYYYDSSTAEIIPVTKITKIKKSSFYYLKINDKYETRVRYHSHKPETVYLYHMDTKIPVYESIENFSKDAAIKFKSTMTAYNNAVKTIKLFEDKEKAITKIYKNYPEYFI